MCDSGLRMKVNGRDYRGTRKTSNTRRQPKFKEEERALEPHSKEQEKVRPRT